ncbi:MAG: hypothetical protein KBA31_19030 [Alphaproteobacteria bacterium]|nr:hypothetical protein [Alphaproteobacteria bacterium]
MANDDHDVGFRRPPKATQFKKGRSGNPRGRPKGTRNFSTDLKETLSRPVQVTEAGRSRSISTQQASLERLREKALRGDQRALDRLLQLAERHAEDETAAHAEEKLAASEVEILTNYAGRIREQAINDYLAKRDRFDQTATTPNVESASNNESNHES